MIALDRDWLAAHKLPGFAEDASKNDRGRVLALGGSLTVPGALRLSGEAALRAGAGKLQMATVAEAALPLGMLVPEAAVVGLAAGPDGELASDGVAAALGDRLEACDALLVGPGMAGDCAALVTACLGVLGEDTAVVIDAAAIGACRTCGAAVRALAGRAVLTPQHGEMAAHTGRDADWIADHPEEAAQAVADELGAVMVLKGAATLICAPGQEPLRYADGGPELATGGSGDVLAGVVAALLSRGVAPVVAAAWAVRAHGEAGRAAGHGLLARDLLAHIPRGLTLVA